MNSLFRRSQAPATGVDSVSRDEPGDAGDTEFKGVAAAAAHVEEIIATAERLAALITTEAEAEAERRLARADAQVERLVSEGALALVRFADLLGEHEARIRERTEAMVAELGETMVAMRAAPERSGTRPAVTGLIDEDAGRPHDAARVTDPKGPSNAPLRAAQLAVAGASREEIEQTLRADFAVGDPAPVLDELLGPKGG